MQRKEMYGCNEKKCCLFGGKYGNIDRHLKKSRIGENKMKQRETFTSRLGFVMACIGSAIGLGNIWLFPYRLGEYGGAAFLIPYFIFVLLLGSVGLMMEFSFGRHFHGGSMTGIVRAFEEKGKKGGKIVGVLPAIGLLGIFLFYNIVVGWILKYLVMSVSGGLKGVDKTTYFNGFAGSSKSIPWDLLAIGLTVLIICGGIVKGIERISKIIMPALFVIFIALAIRSVTLPGAEAGIAFLLKPEWSHLLEADTWVMALGQAFFTVSLNGCGMVVYGSYLKKEYNIPKLAVTTAVLDTCAAILASFVIMPAVFAFDLDVKSGPPLLFMTMPSIFEQMPGGQIVAIVFFVSLLFAGISSSINMLEGVVEAMTSHTKLTRKKAVVIVGIFSALVSIPLNLSMTAFDGFTNFITILISPLMVLVVLVVYLYLYDSKKALEEINTGSKHHFGNGFMVFLKYIFALVTVAVIILGVAYGGIG